MLPLLLTKYFLASVLLWSCSDWSLSANTAMNIQSWSLISIDLVTNIAYFVAISILLKFLQPYIKFFQEFLRFLDGPSSDNNRL